MKSTKKLLSLLLVFVMVFSLAVPVFAEGETPATATKVDTVANGDQVVIYNAGAGKAMTAESYTYTNSKNGSTKDELKSVAATVADGKTVILHSNDVHGAIAGYANMAALAAEYEAKGATVIVADAGDFSQGTVYVSSSKGADAVSMMNAAGYDIAIPGNHEFDYGYAQLVENLKSAKFDTICCNILDADGNLVFAPSKVVEVDGMKIGFIGVNTPESQTKANPALIKGLKWLAGEDMVKAVQAEADKLADTVDVTIVISHLGVDDSSVPNTSYDLLKGLNGVDFIIDGHSHTVMTAGDNKEPIQSTGTAFANIGVIVIDNEKKAIESNELVEITKDSAKDETVAAAAQAIIDKIDAEYGEVFAKSDVDLNGEKSVDANGVFGNRDGETNLGDLITDSMIWQVKQNLDGITVPAENIVAITNGGGIRAAIAKGDITKKDVNTVLPFGNTIAVVYVTGAELLEALEASTYCSPYSTIGGYPQVAGIEMTINPDKAYDANEETYPGSTYYGPKTINRVTIDSINGKAFDEKATYAVVTNNFCAAGGDTYYAFASASAQFDTGIPLDEALMSYITDELKGVVGEQYAEPQGRINYHVHDFEDGHGTCNTCGFAPFSDIANSGYCDYIVVGWAAGIVGGYPDGTFRPNNEVTRGQFITMLWRACGEPEAENAKLSFTDAANIPDDYKAAVAWGVEAGIIYGYGDNTFRHGTPISRAQMATFSYRLMDVIFEDGSFDAFKTPFGFNDDAAVAADYVDGVNVCANLGVITGYPDGFFRPNATGTRGQAATIILRLVLTIGELVEG